MRTRKGLFIVTALAEGLTGLFLVSLPAVVIRLLIGVNEPSAEAIIVGRVAGVCLIALAVAWWWARNDYGSGSQDGLLRGMLIYNLGVSIALASGRWSAQLSGLLFWPVVVLHIVLAIWCLMNWRVVR